MTDKQIIIDGVDVSGCINYRPSVDTTQVSYTNACSIGIWQRWYSNLEPNCIMSCSCKDNPNCYYKNWQRKEQECEELSSKCSQIKQTLAEIKPILELYANSTIGTHECNGIFKLEVFDDNVLGGKFICYYDTNPAREALRKINECEVDK